MCFFVFDSHVLGQFALFCSVSIQYAQTSLVITRDGSHSLRNELTGEHYHSIFGAFTESKYVFEKMGLLEADQSVAPLRLLEVGVGTGLNLLLALAFARDHCLHLQYTGLEPFPVEPEQIAALNYGQFADAAACAWWQSVYMDLLNGKSQQFSSAEVEVVQQSLLQFQATQPFDLVFYDAFSPSSEESMWNDASIDHVSSLLAPGGRLVTYCIRGYIRRRFMANGLLAEKRPGPPGKREMMVVTNPH
jgi:tRNA U34 5-methylaminomethyl-2-thiouridine-forming methyltransferase MnmC